MTQWRRPYKLRRDATHAKRPFFHQPGKWVSAENFPVCIPHSRRVSPDVTLRGRRAAPGVEMKFQRCLEGKKKRERGRPPQRGRRGGGKSTLWVFSFPKNFHGGEKSPYCAPRTRDSAVTAIGTAASCGFTGETFTRPKTSP